MKWLTAFEMSMALGRAGKEEKISRKKSCKHDVCLLM
jgi:hypothetical protein